MKKLFFLAVLLIISCCSTKKNVTNNTLYEILTEQKDGGASIEFYEILSEKSEISMLLSDDNLRRKITESDIATCNFVILNSGYKNEGKNKIEIESVVETDKNIIISIKTNPNENKPKIELTTVNPYVIIKIKSKKEILFR